ncbi:pyridoxamine 5'-phosphate oxidase [Bowmanella denitrificans]|uniref:Pyridoxamine 5'-phosphate oxidase n=1 Tax=Bowmanella denitrificans TaxID=366582 RepID=A0ABN0WMR0_9ALTE
MIDPIIKFQRWWHAALHDSPLQQKSAVCVSTVDAQGIPDGRFVDLKAADYSGFVFCTNLDSPKGLAISDNPNVAMTIWWDHMGYQVRIVGQAQAIQDKMADQYWHSRHRDAKISTLALQQSQPVADEQLLWEQVTCFSEKFAEQEIARPVNWGGYTVVPQRIEFLTFRESRVHLRELYIKQQQSWHYQLLQP